MVTEEARQALDNLRDSGNFQWYVIPLLLIVMYIYAKEIKSAQETGNWNIVITGLAFFGMDLFNEIWNSLVFHFTQDAAFWMTPSDSAYIIMIGWNIEIAFMFAISGIMLGNVLPKDKKMKILGIPNRWAISIGFSIFAVFVEVLLNMADQLIWTYSFWNYSIYGIWLIIIFGYLHFFVVSFLIHDMERMRNKIIAVSIIYIIDLSALILFMGILGWI